MGLSAKPLSWHVSHTQHVSPAARTADKKDKGGRCAESTSRGLCTLAARCIAEPGDTPDRDRPWALARAHARTGRATLISGYLGSSEAFDHAIAEFGSAYADQNERDYQRLADAAASGRVHAMTGI